MRIHLALGATALLAALSGCNPPINCGVFVYSEAEGRCTCPPGFRENDDLTDCVPVDGGTATTPDAGAMPDAGSAPDAAVCTEGATMPCGTSDVGACALGTLRCTGGTWGACEGAIEPTTETCNDVDDDCDGTTDEDLRTTFYRDADGDGHGTDAESLIACAAPAGFVAAGGDCNDGNASVHPLQTSYFTTAIPGATAGARYDYDCSGTEDHQYPNAFMCSTSSGSCTAVVPGFLLIIGTAPPACGEGRDNFITGCTAGCATIYATRVQGCR